MLLRIHHHHPVGMVENSPAFQRRDEGEKPSSPEGAAEEVRVSRPFGTGAVRSSNPALKRRAILVCPSGKLEFPGALSATVLLVPLIALILLSGCERQVSNDATLASGARPT